MKSASEGIINKYALFIFLIRVEFTSKRAVTLT